MTILKILTEPNKILRTKSLEVENVDKDIQNLMDDMLETLYAAPGIGLAAIQVGVPKRVIVMDLTRDKEKEPKKPHINYRVNISVPINQLLSCFWLFLIFYKPCVESPQ